MPVFPGTYIPTGVASSSKFNHLIDDLMTPRLMSFRQINIQDERATLSPEDNLTWSTTFGNWLEAAPLRVRKNEQPLASSAYTVVSLVDGTIQAGTPDVGADNRPRDRALFQQARARRRDPRAAHWSASQ